MQAMQISWRRLRLLASRLRRVLVPIIQKIRTTHPSHIRLKTRRTLSQIMLTMPIILPQLIVPTSRSLLRTRKHQKIKLPRLILTLRIHTTRVRFLTRGIIHSHNIRHMLLSWLTLLLRIQHGQLLLRIHNGLLMLSTHLSSPKLLPKINYGHNLKSNCLTH